MRGFDQATILSPSFHDLSKATPDTMTPHLCIKYDEKPWGVLPEKLGGTLPETLTLFQKKICDFPYPISDLIKNLIPYFRPEALEPGARDKLLRHVQGWRKH